MAVEVGAQRKGGREASARLAATSFEVVVQEGRFWADPTWRSLLS